MKGIDGFAGLIKSFAKWFMGLSKEVFLFGCAAVTTIVVSVTVVYFKTGTNETDSSYKEISIQLNKIEKNLEKITANQDSAYVILEQVVNDMEEFKTSVIQLITIEAIKSSKSNVLIENIYSTVKDKITSKDIREVLLDVLREEALKEREEAMKEKRPYESQIEVRRKNALSNIEFQ